MASRRRKLILFGNSNLAKARLYTASVVDRIKNVSGYGYTLDSTLQAQLFNRIYGFYKSWGRVPRLWYDAEFSVNRNILTTTGTPATQTTPYLDTGTYTLHVDGSGSALASGGTATITGASSASNGVDNTFTITVAGTVTVTVTGTLTFFQLERGSLFSSRHDRADATTVKVLNLGTDGALGDGTFTGTNARSATMITILANGRRSFISQRASSQYIVTTYTSPTDTGRLMFMFHNKTDNTNAIGMGIFPNPNDRMLLRPVSSTQFQVSVNLGFATVAGSPSINTWYSYCGIYDNL